MVQFPLTSLERLIFLSFLSPLPSLLKNICNPVSRNPSRFLLKKNRTVEEEDIAPVIAIFNSWKDIVLLMVYVC